MERNPRTTLEAHRDSFLDHLTPDQLRRKLPSADDRSIFLSKGRWWGGQDTRKNSTDCLPSHCVCVIHSPGSEKPIKIISKTNTRKFKTQFTCQIQVRNMGMKKIQLAITKQENKIKSVMGRRQRQFKLDSGSR